MKTKEYLIYSVILVTCVVAVGLSMIGSGSLAREYHDPDFVIPNTGLGAATSAFYTDRSPRLEASATPFPTATSSPTATITSTPSPTFTLTFSPTVTPTASPTPALISPTSTRRPREQAPATSAPAPIPTNPPPTHPPATNPPPTNPPPTNPPPTDPPSLPTIISTIIPLP